MLAVSMQGPASGQTQALHGTQNMQHCAMLDTAGCQASHRLPLLWEPEIWCAFRGNARFSRPEDASREPSQHSRAAPGLLSSSDITCRYMRIWGTRMLPRCHVACCLSGPLRGPPKMHLACSGAGLSAGVRGPGAQPCGEYGLGHAGPHAGRLSQHRLQAPRQACSAASFVHHATVLSRICTTICTCVQRRS